MPPTHTLWAKGSRVRTFLENVLYVGCAIGLAFLIQTFVVRPFIVSGGSMDPIIKNGQYLIIDEVAYRFKDIARGDVVVFRSPPEPDKYYIKRVVGLPGETVEVKGGTVIIYNSAHPDGFALGDDFIVHHSTDTVSKTIVPPQHYFVMGDNRSGSYDSRSWGSLPKENIRGRALLRLLPLNMIDYLPGKITYEN